MKELTGNIGLKKGDIITMIEVCPISQGAGTPNLKFIDTTFEHKFLIKRINAKTYTCLYIEGAYKGSGFGWIKTDKLGSKEKYYK